MMKRRAFLGGTLSATTVGTAQSITAIAQSRASAAQPEPLLWPLVTKPLAGIRSFDGHTDTVLDVVGRLGTPASLVIFTEGNHLMVLLGDDVLGAFPSWAKSQPSYADLDLRTRPAISESRWVGFCNRRDSLGSRETISFWCD